MPKTYKYTDEQISELTQTYKNITNDAKAARRVQIVLLRAQGNTVNFVIKATGTSTTTITRLTSNYLNKGIESLLTTKHKGNHRYLTAEQLESFLKEQETKAENGQLVTIKQVFEDYQALIGHEININSFYKLLKRHNWRKIRPRPHHPKQADVSTQEASKKLT